MTLSKPLPSIQEIDLQNLIDIGIPEGLNTEYKRDLYGNKDSDIKEFLKDVTSFANTFGGHLVLGLAENHGLPTALVPMNINPDEEIGRLESLMRDGVEPRLRAEVRAVPLSPTGYCIVVRIPRSQNSPHRVSARGTNRIYGRNSAGAYELSMEELRSVFNEGAAAENRARAWWQERLRAIETGNAPVELASERSRLVIHIVPLSTFSGRRMPLDLEKAQQLHNDLRPPGDGLGYSPRLNLEGFLVRRGGPQCFGYTQLFRNGSIEGLKVRVLMDRDGQSVIPSFAVEQAIVDAVPAYISALEQLEVPPPFAVSISLQNVGGSILGVASNTYDMPEPIRAQSVELPDVVIAEFGDIASYRRAVKPALDALWNSAGFIGSQYYRDGEWVGKEG